MMTFAEARIIELQCRVTALKIQAENMLQVGGMEKAIDEVAEEINGYANEMRAYQEQLEE